MNLKTTLQAALLLLIMGLQGVWALPSGPVSKTPSHICQLNETPSPSWCYSNPCDEASDCGARKVCLNWCLGINCCTATDAKHYTCSSQSPLCPPGVSEVCCNCINSNCDGYCGQFCS